MKTYYEVSTKKFQKSLFSVNNDLEVVLQNAPSYFKISFSYQRKFKNTTE